MDNNDKKTVDLVLDDHRKFGEEQKEKALEDFKVYMGAKYNVDSKATENQEWWRLRHWSTITGQTNEAQKAGIEVGSAWAINSLLNKHADIMDSFPKPNVLPREADDEMEAKLLTDILPAILDQNDYEAVYRQAGWDTCIDGANIRGAFWDQAKHDGLGDISIKNVDVHNLAWQPGVNNIQESDKVYHASIMDIDVARKQWSNIADKIGPQDSGIILKYVHDDYIDTSHSVEVINMYYKVPTLAPVYMDGIGKDGSRSRIKIHEIPKMVLHLAIIVGGELAWCSENEPGYENGFYEHGKYPFIFSRLFPIKDSPWGFGYFDIIKNPQKDIDRLDQAIIKNAMMRARPRYWARKNANIDLNEFVDWNTELVEVAGGELGEAVKKIDVDDVPSGAMNHYMNKIEELKETSGNRDFNQGGVSGGITAASAVAALQEAGSKLSRDINKELYRAERELYYMIIELIRQFYTEPRSFRIADKNTGDYRFVQYSNAGIVEQDVMLPDGTVRHIRPVFDITVSAEKSSPFSRAAQNETIKELYGMGLFAPENAVPALVCIDGMDFEGKEHIRQQIEQNSIFLQQFQSAMQFIQQVASIDPAIAQMAMQQGLIAPEMAMEMQATQEANAPGGTQRPSSQGTPEERAARKTTAGGENSLAAKARLRAANATNPA